MMPFGSAGAVQLMKMVLPSVAKEVGGAKDRGWNSAVLNWASGPDVHPELVHASTKKVYIVNGLRFIAVKMADCVSVSVGITSPISTPSPPLILYTEMIPLGDTGGRINSVMEVEVALTISGASTPCGGASEVVTKAKSLATPATLLTAVTLYSYCIADSRLALSSR